MALGPGSIAFVGFNADGNDSLAFVILEPVLAGDVITFTDNEWSGSSFNTGEATWTWTASQDFAAGTVVTMSGLGSGQTAASNFGTIAFSDSTQRDIALATEGVYAYTGEASAPGFLAAISNRVFAASSGLLTNTGLIQGQTAISLQSLDSDADIAAYAGIRGAASFDALLPLINNPANWIAQDSSASNENDGTPPDLPFSTEPFVGDPNLQTVNFAAGSPTQVEGDSGETLFTFTVERSGGTSGTVNFAGAVGFSGTSRADDFAALSFNGTIEDGQTSATVTIRVQGDAVFEPDENFTVTLRSASNGSVGTVVASNAVATGTIVNDDVASVNIAFVGFNGDGTDSLAFLAVSDIAAGTVIYFHNSEWLGSNFNPNSILGGMGAWSWTTDADIAAGTVVTMNDLNTGSATSNLGTVTLISPTPPNLRDDNFEIVYAYLGASDAPTSFLTALSTSPVFIQNGATLAGTGLTAGVNAIALGTGLFDDIDIAYYNGPRTGFTNVEDYLPSIYDPANWVKQENFAVDNSADGIFPDVPFPALPFSTDPTAQIVQFAGALSVTQPEGTGGDTVFSFTVERTNGTEGDLAFTVRVPVAPYSDSANATDFGGTLPVITGTIPDGESSATVTIVVKGDTFFELNERFNLIVESAFNPDASSVVIGNNSAVMGTIGNDDTQPTRVLAGEDHSAGITLTGDTHFVIEQGGSTRGISWRGDVNLVIDNAGQTGSIAAGNSQGTVTINNLATGIIRGVVSAEDAGRTNYTLNNAGRIELAGDRMDLRDAAEAGGTVVVNNLAGGVIMQTDTSQDIIRPGDNAVINNYGSILHTPGVVGGSSDGIDYQNVPGAVNNYAGGLIEASRHAVTGDAPVALFNEGTMIGRNGSAINIDSNGTEAQRVFITNHGRMEGRSANLTDSDGDAVDIDGLVTLENFGRIAGMGHNGYHDGEPNVSEGLAIGGGTITNHAGGEIYGHGRAIQVDNSSNSNALGTTTIVNHGLIRGDGNLPTGVTPEEVAQFAERIRGGEAISLLGDYGDEITNTGTIIGGVKMGGGNDLLVNNGVMTATGGSAANLGDGNDTFEAHAGSTVTGTLDGGDGNDALQLIGPGVGSLGAVVNVENLAVQGGIWTLQSGGHDTVTVATGAMVMSQLKLNDQGEMTVAAGGSVLVTNGSDAIVAEGSASIENNGLIQALGMTGTTPAKAITINGGEVTNKAGGIILAQGPAIATGAAAVAGVEIINEGMVQSLSGQAITLVGDQADTVTNKSMIMGSVDLGAGDDTLTIYTASSITGALIGGTGEDTIRLSATNPASTGTFGTANGFEALVAEEGSWSVAAGAAAFSDVTVEGGATITSQIVLSGEDKLTVEDGGAISVNQSVQSAVLLSGASTDVVIENAGQIRSGQNTFGAIGGVYTNEPHSVTILNHESGQIVAEYNAAIGIRTNRGSSGTISIENAGLIESFNGNALQLQDVYGSALTIDNKATGIIRAGAGQDTVRLGTATLINAGTIVAADMADAFSDAVDFQTSVGGVVNNLEGGLIEGARHGITGKRNVTINNEDGATIYGRNGSGVNFDTEEGRDEAFVVTNHGTIRGAAVIDAPDTFESDIDGDGVDVDYTVLLHNYGVIEALGAKGYKDGFENFSEGVAAGGGEIYNHEGGVIFSVDNGILVDDGEEGPGYAATLIENEGTIEGRDGYGIKLVGEFADTITNKGTIKGGSGLAIDMGAGDDTLNAYAGSSIVGAIVGGDGTDTVHLLGTGTGSLGSTTGFENLVVQGGMWSVADGAVNFSDITIEDGATVTSGLIVDGDDHLVVEAGGALVVTGDAITWQRAINGGDVVIDNAGLIEASGRVLNTEVNAIGNFTFNNLAGGVVHGSFNPRQEVRPESIITFNNAGLIEDGGRVFDLKELVKDGAQAVINNLAGGVIRQTGGDGEEDVMFLDDNTVVNNWGTIISQAGSVGGGDAINFDSGRGSSVHNYAGGLIEGSRHAVTGKQDFTIVNEGTMIGRNGSAVNFDTNADELVTITNRGTMEGRSAELSDSDGDAIDVDGLVQVLNYGRIAGLGAEGYHDGEPNVSEGIAVGGGSIVNNATGEIYGYGRGIQVDNSSNENALGATTIVNDGLIQGDGHGPEGVDPADAAQFDLRGNEAINLVGDYEDFVGNNSTGRIVGGVSMGGGRDTLNNSGSIVATGGSAIDMGDGNDQLNLYVGSTVTGMILLGDGDDVANSTSAAAYVIDGGDGNDSIAMYYTIFGGDDVLFGGAGNDTISGGLGEDRIDGGLDNDTLYGENGDDLIEGGDGNDTIDGGADDDVIFGDGGHDTIVGGLGNDTIKGNAGNDVFVVTTTADGRDSYDGGAGVDTLDFSAFSQGLNLTLRDGTTTFATDTIENIENVIGGSGADKLTGNALGNVLTGNAGADTLKGGAGNDTLDGGEGSDILDGGADNDRLAGGLGDDELKGAAGNDMLDGGEGSDSLDGGAGNDQIAGGLGADALKGAAGNDDLDGGAGADTLDGGAGDDFLFGGAGADTLTGGAGFDQFMFASVGGGVDTITDFKVSGASEDQIVLSASMFENFSGDDAFDLIGSGYMRTVTGGGTTQLQIDVDGGGNSFTTIALLNGTISNGVLADHVIIHQDLIA